VFINNEPIPQNPIRVVIDKSLTDADPMHTVAYGPGLEGGFTSEPSIFTVECRNSKGEKLTRGGHPVDVDVSDGSGSELNVRVNENNDGTYTVTYQPVEPGVHRVDVFLRHKVFPIYYEHIKASPFRVTVGAGTDGHSSIAYGPGLEDGKVNDQHPTNFTIQAKDRNGNNMNRGGDPFEVKIQGPDGPVDADIKDNGDGTYNVDYAPKSGGRHKIDVTLKGQPVQKSPFVVNVKEAADEGTSLIDSYSFIIQGKTKKGALRKDGGDDFKVSITGPRGQLNAELKDLNNGTYLVTYRLPDPGNYTIQVTVNGKVLKQVEHGIKVQY